MIYREYIRTPDDLRQTVGPIIAKYGAAVAFDGFTLDRALEQALEEIVEALADPTYLAAFMEGYAFAKSGRIV